MRKYDGVFSRAAVIFVTLWLLPLLGFTAAYAARNASVAITSVELTPTTVTPGRYPDITASISAVSNESTEVSIVAVLVRPDHVVKSWLWKKVGVVTGEKKMIVLPKEYDTRLAGAYKIEFVIYSVDMSRRLHALSRNFTVTEQAMPQPMEGQAVRKEPERKLSQAQERTHLGIGVYGNSLNPAGGATVMLWPFRNVGLQGIYSVGVFTSYEGRLLIRIESSSGFNPYLGAGFLHVSKKKKVIDVDTTFEDGKVSGVAGVEMLLGRRVRGYMEVSGAGIKLEKDVTNGAQTAHATVKYIPVTIGVGLVWSVF